jgi:hypothetical protein
MNLQLKTLTNINFKKECKLHLLGYIIVATNKEWAAPSSSEVGEWGEGDMGEYTM